MNFKITSALKSGCFSLQVHGSWSTSSIRERSPERRSLRSISDLFVGFSSTLHSVVMGAECLERSCPEVASCTDSLDVVNDGGLSNPSLALTPLAQWVIAKDRFSEALPGSCLVPGVTRSLPALLGWSPCLPRTFGLVADDRRHRSKTPSRHGWELAHSSDIGVDPHNWPLGRSQTKEDPL